mgnify:CR=1 FL=1
MGKTADECCRRACRWRAMTERSKRLRVWGALWVLGLLAWLPLEDRTLSAPLLLGFWGGAWLALRGLGRRRLGVWQKVVVGIAVGAGALALAVVLIAFKSGLHAHGFADVSLGQLRRSLGALPFLVGAGVLAALLQHGYTTILRRDGG